ncbi:MAG: trypsin-like peptidase domain-containing protein [Planctomycetes bacterium]|nr:trypsin-like peptidase domain-containing protein [Planctomycetota bacterium]
MAKIKSCRFVIPSLIFLLLAWSPRQASPGDEKPEAPGERPMDFRQIIAQAKSKVFPALIYVAPVVEEFSGGKREKREQGGSGVIISPEGYAVTNWHVIEKAVSIRVLLFDGRFTTAEKIGEDRETDVGLLKIKPPREAAELPHARFADSGKLREGEFVLAMGAPWGLSRSVSLGIISSTTRYLPGRSEYSLWLQTDASINPGNSGGPLVNTEGEVVGINTLGSIVGGDLGFAVPANTVKRIVDSLRSHGTVQRSWTGLRLQPLHDFDRNIYFEGSEGVLIASVDKGSPALRAGFHTGDLLLKAGSVPVNGLNYEDIPAINTLLGDLPVNQEVQIALQRDGKDLALTLTPRAKGKVEGEDFELKDWNMTVKAINEFETPALFFFVKEGVYVQGTREPGNAAKAGLRRGDILIKVDGQAVTTIEELQTAYQNLINDSKRDKKALLEVLRNGLTYRIVLDYSTRYKD